MEIKEFAKRIRDKLEQYRFLTFISERRCDNLTEFIEDLEDEHKQHIKEEYK